MYERVNSALQDECRLDLHRPVLVGVSGGPDSVCLAHSLWRSGYPLVIAHFNHMLRPEANAEADFVKKLAGKLGAKLAVKSEDVSFYAGSHGLSIEEAARLLRYRFLFSEARQHEAQAVAIGHTADDQIETLLMHMLRGAGLSGLTGMAIRTLPNPWSQEIALVRPLLTVWREEVEAYNREQGLSAVQDHSNWDLRYQRNRIRHELIPYLERYNPGIRQLLWQTADLLREDQRVLDLAIETAWRMCLREKGRGYLALDTLKLKEQPLGLKRQILRRAIHELLPGLQNIDYAAIRRAVEALNQPVNGALIDLSAGLMLKIEADRLWIAFSEADLPLCDWPQLLVGEQILPIPGTLSLANGWQLSARLMGLQTSLEYEQILNNPDPNQAWINSGSLSHPLKVRSRLPGDRFRPLGLGGHSIKLSDFMINVKIPSRARRLWPLVVSGEEILWLPGFRLAHAFGLQGETQQIVHLQLKRL
jgi:tRNA(Ile)-lysidine synthase